MALFVEANLFKKHCPNRWEEFVDLYHSIYDTIQDVLVTLESQYHLIRMCDHHENIFIYVVIDRDQGNLGLARRKIDQIDEVLELE